MTGGRTVRTDERLADAEVHKALAHTGAVSRFRDYEMSPIKTRCPSLC